MISPTFVEANYEVFESLLRERRKKVRNEDLRNELEYFSDEYDEKRNVESGGPSKLGERENRSRGMNLPPLLAAHQGRIKNGQALQSSLTSIYGGHHPSTNIGVRTSRIMLNLSYLVVHIHPMDSILLMLTLTPNHLRVSSMGKLRVTLLMLRMVTPLLREPTTITHK
ncbi:hypothetical protein Tco_1557370 [Tanacetum coccineum]